MDIGNEARAKALEIAVSILGSMDKTEIEKTDKQGEKIIKQYFWLAKTIRDFILFPKIFDELDAELQK